MAAVLMLAGCSEGTAVVSLNRALRTCNGLASEAVELPDEVLSPPDQTAPVRCTYRFEIDRPPQGTGILIPNLIAHAKVAVNDAEVFQAWSEPTRPLPRSVDRVVLLEIPDRLWSADRNVIEIEAAGPRFIQVSKLRIGPVPQLRSEHRTRLLGAVVGPSLVGAMLATLGLCMLLLWLRRRDSLYGYFGSGSALWGLHTLWTASPWSPFSGAIQAIAWTSLYALFVSLLIVFCVRFAGWRWPRAERTLWTFCLAAPLMLIAAVPSGNLGMATEGVRLVLLVLVGLGLFAVVRASIRQPDVDRLLVTLSGVASLAFGIHDWILGRVDVDEPPLYLVPYAGLTFVVFVVRMLIARFARTTEELESVNRELGERVVEQTAELRSAVNSMRQAKDAAEAADHEKTRFLAAASHDLRQPAHALALYMAALRAQPLQPAHADLVERMSGSLAALEAMFSMLLDVSRIDAGALTPNVAPFAIEPLLRRLADEFAPQAEAQGLRMALRLPSSASPNAFAISDPMLVERLLRNLLTNAVKYTSKGGILIACRPRQAKHTREEAVRAADWRIEVWDTGIGIAESDQGRVFEEFFQVDNPGRDRANGLGLGLSIVQRIARLLHHDLVLCSRPGRGSMFALYLAACDHPTATTELQVDPKASVTGLRLGLIEDDHEVRDAMRTLLLTWGCRVVGAADADGLRAELARDPTFGVPDAVLVDQRLADGKTGPVEAARLFAWWGRSVPMLVITGEADVGNIEAACQEWMSKPASPVLLRSWLAGLLRSADPFAGSRHPRQPRGPT